MVLILITLGDIKYEHTKLEGGEFIFLDVMTIGKNEEDKKICELVVTREELMEAAPDVPVTGMAVLHQQFLLVQAINEWITELKKGFE